MRLRCGELESDIASNAQALLETSAKLAAERQLSAQLQTALLDTQRLVVLGQLTGGVAHDFNNILLAIQGSFELLSKRVHDNLGVRLVQNGSMAAERAAGLVRNLLAFARQQEQHPVAIDLTVVLASIGDLVRQAMGHKVELAIKAVPAGTWHVFGKPHEIEVALLNLAVNGRDAMPGGGTLEVSAHNLPGAVGKRWPGQPDGDCVLLTVRDTGTGMPPDVLARAMEPFFTTKAPGKGTGLGLAMVHKMAQQFGGALHIESVFGEGTTMLLVLPRADRQNAVAVATVVEIDRARHGGAVLLVVDDDEQVRAVTAGFLRDIGYRVIEAANGEAAYALALASGLIDLVVTDVAMPGADGPMLAARLRAEWPSLPIIFITGFSGNADLTGEVVLAKPYAFSDLAEQVIIQLGRAATAPKAALEPERAALH